VLFTVPSAARQPVAGHSFAGLAIVSIEYSLKDVHCDGQIGFKRLAAQKEFFYGNGRRPAVVCSWQIPKTAGGKTLRLWPYEGIHRAQVTVGPFEPAASAELSWHVQKR
jgi:hypothetical protein